MLLMHWGRHAPRAAQGSGVKEGFHLFYLSPLFRLHRAQPQPQHPPPLLQILIEPTVIYQSRTLYFRGASVCVSFLHRSDSKQWTGSGRRKRRRNDFTCPASCRTQSFPNGPFTELFEFVFERLWSAFSHPLKCAGVSLAMTSPQASPPPLRQMPVLEWLFEWLAPQRANISFNHPCSLRNWGTLVWHVWKVNLFLYSWKFI